jgi:DNA (cytosine-5)-methyltransferase 1
VLGAADVGAPHRRDRFWLVANSNEHAWNQRRPGDSEQGPRGWNADRSAECANDLANAARHEQGRPQQRPEWQRAWQGGESELADLADASSLGSSAGNADSARGQERHANEPHDGSWWLTEPDVGRVAHGVAARVDRLKALGNGQVPQCAAEAWRLLTHNDQGKRRAEGESA